ASSWGAPGVPLGGSGGLPERNPKNELRRDTGRNSLRVPGVRARDYGESVTSPASRHSGSVVVHRYARRKEVSGMKTQLVHTPGTVASHVRRTALGARRHTDVTVIVQAPARSVYADLGDTYPAAGLTLSARPGCDVGSIVTNDRPALAEPIGSSTAVPLLKIKRAPAPPG